MISSTLFAFEVFGHTYLDRQLEVYSPGGIINPPMIVWLGQRPECQWSLFE